MLNMYASSIFASSMDMEGHITFYSPALSLGRRVLIVHVNVKFRHP